MDRAEYVTAAQLKEIVEWMLGDPLLCDDQKANERLVRGFRQFWLESESRWIRPNKASGERVVKATLEAVLAR